MKNKNFQITVHGICMTVLFVMILMVANCPNTYAATINLKCGQKVRDSRSKNYYQAPACPKPCTTQNPSDVCLASTPTPILLPAPIPSPVPTAQPTPTPTNPPAPSGKSAMFYCAMYGSAPPWGSYNSSDLSKLNKYKSYCTYLLTWWYALPSQSACNYALASSTIEYCGPYDDYGFQFKDKWWEKSKQYDLGIPFNYGANETVMNWGAQGYIDFYLKRFNEGIPGTDKSGRPGTGWNLRFMDNGYLNPQSTGAVSTNLGSQWPQTVLNANTQIVGDAQAKGYKLFMNIYSDVNFQYFKDIARYRDFVRDKSVLFERWGIDVNTGNALTETEVKTNLDVAKDISKNTNAVTVFGTDYGDFWYNMALGFLVCSEGRCGFWQQNPMTDIQVTKMRNLDLGLPTADYTKAGCYIRPWTKGLVIANPTDSSCSVPLSGSYTDLETGATLSGSVTVNSKDGKVLVEE